MKRILLLVLSLSSLVTAGNALAWDYEGHRVVNQLALEALPESFPGFVRSPDAVERIAFLSGEADRWRNVPDLSFKHATGPDHYIDIEELADYGLSPQNLPIFRSEFVAQLALASQANPSKFPQIDPRRNQDRTRELVGLLPWAMTENFGRLKSAFSYLKAFQEHGGTSEEVANAQANVVYTMGVMGHFYADATQPLHTTIHHHGWVGPNPNNYTTNRNFHSWIDGGYFAKVGPASVTQLKSRVRPAKVIMLNDKPAKADQAFQVMMNFLLEQHRLVERIYRLEKEGRLSGNGTRGLEGKAFLEEQLVKGAQLLADTWLTAWEQAPADTFLQNQLAKRQKPAKR